VREYDLRNEWFLSTFTKMNDHRALLEALRAPDCYPHPVASIELRETHISSVLLTGEFVYKIKKPVRLAFLDFSTLGNRRGYCEEELRLNRRFAPELYLNVMPITGSVAAPRLGGSGEPIEYAVKLRQFDVAEELTSLLQHQCVAPDELRSFGSYLAGVHAQSLAQRGPSAAWQTVRRNLQELGDAPESLVQWLTAEQARLQPLLDERGIGGRIRECHGDLHAGNVVRWRGVLTAFDCIEFNADMRRIDVADDVAFLMMDLLARGRRDLAYAFANGWLEASGDYPAVQLLRWFRVHRALVRTKVERLEHHAAKAEMYLRTALAELAPSSPRLFVMCGLSGSGKTWASTQLLQGLGCIRVRSDVERKRMAGLQPDESSRSLPGEGIYTRELNDRVYAQLRSTAESLLRAGEPVVVDAAFLRRHERLSFIELAREVGVAVHIVHCHAPESELRARLRQRQGDASEATEEVLAKQLQYWEPFETAERGHVVELDTRDPEGIGRVLGSVDRGRTS
jgi:uncharacterized protein